MTDLAAQPVPDASAFAARPRRGAFDPWPTAVVVLALIVALPVFAVLAHVFVPAGDVWRHLSETVLPRYVANSLWLMLGVGAGTFLIGVPAAWMVTMWRFPGVRAFEWAMLLPMAIPAYVIAYAYTGLFDYAGPVQTALRDLFGWHTAMDYVFPEIRSLGGAIVMMSLVLYPYVYMMARAAFLEQSVCVLEASRVLGRGPWASFFRVALPLARPAVVAGMALALMEALNDFGTVQYFAVDTFTTGIYRTWMGLGEPVAAAQIGAVLMLFVFALLVLERTSRGKGSYRHSGRRRSPHPVSMRGWRAGFAVVACAIPVVFGFVVPFALLVVWSVRTAPEMVDERFFGFALNSFLLAAAAAVAAVAVGTILAYGRRLHPTPLVRASVRFAGMGYAIPGAVIAVGALVPLTAFDVALSERLYDWFGLDVGLILTGTVVALVFAYLVRFLPISLNAVETSLGRITPSIEGAARSLGESPAGVLRRVHIPMMRASLLTAGLLVFVDVMKELPATLIMRPFDFDTLAVRAFELASDERLAESSSAALTIVAVGVVPVILLSRAIGANARSGADVG